MAEPNAVVTFSELLSLNAAVALMTRFGFTVHCTRRDIICSDVFIILEGTYILTYIHTNLYSAKIVERILHFLKIQMS